MAQPTVAAWRERIPEMATHLVGGKADLWLSDALRQLPGMKSSSFPAVPPSMLMRRAIDSRRITFDEKADTNESLVVAIPLRAQETILGVLEVRRTEGTPFTDDEIAHLDGLVTQSALALEATRQLTLERWRGEQLALVRAVSAQVANVLDLDELARRVTTLIIQTFDYYHVALFTLEPSQELLLQRANAGPRQAESVEHGDPSSFSVQIGQGIVGHVAATGEEIVAEDVSRESRYRHVDCLPETRSEAALPLRVENRVLGVLDVQSDRPGRFTETDVLVLRALADQIAIAVEDARIYSDLQRRADQLSAVAQISRTVASILNLDELFNQVVTLIHERFGYPSVHLFTVDPARRQIVYRAGSGLPEASQRGGRGYSLDDPQGIIPWVARHGETALINDVCNDPRCRPSADILAQLAVPLTFGSEVLGVLNVRSHYRDAFGVADRFLFEALADSVAIAIRNANLYRSERWRRQVAESLQEVAGLLSADVGLEQVLDAILVKLERNLPCDAAAIWLLRDGNLCLSASHGYENAVCLTDFGTDAGPWLYQALHVDQPVVRRSTSPFEPLGAELGFPSDYSAIAAPLRVREQPLGVLTLAHHAPGRYGGESRAMTAAFASYAAVAIENTRLYQDAQEMTRISTVMLQVAEVTRSLTTLDQVLETIVHLVPALAEVNRCAIFLRDETTDLFSPAAAYGLSPDQKALFEEWYVTPGDVPAFDDLILNQDPVFIYDVATDSRVSGSDAWLLGFDSLLMLPMIAQDDVLGVILLDYPSDWLDIDTVRAVDDERLGIIQGIMLQATTAIENTRLREVQREEAYVSAALLQVAQAVVSSGDLDDVLSTITRLTPMLIGVNSCTIFLWDEAALNFRPVQTYGLPHEVEVALLSRHYAPGDLPLLDAARERDDVVISKESGDRDGLAPSDPPDAFWEHLRDVGAALLAIPLSVKGDLLGMMLLEETQAFRRFDERLLEIITGIAQQTALAVQNDRLQRERAERQRLERELQLAHEIQQTFLPGELPRLPGWELAVTWRAARQVSGDFYDVFELADECLGLVIADVADKGMPAALFMALTRTLMRAAALEEKSPAGTLKRVNDLLVPDAQHGMFVTAIYAVLSLETGKLAYANAGHYPPLLLRHERGNLEQLNKGNMALGVLEDTQFEESVVSLEPGDHVVLYTDGVTETFSPEGEIYGEERLRASIQASTDNSAQRLLEDITSTVQDFCGEAPPADDLTVMVLRRLAP